ncbi:MAG: ribonuclease D [Alphaproteobacteria bacterium]
MSVITTSADLADFCKTLEHEDFITVDTEFLREKTYYPKLCLVQLSGANKDARAVDPLAKGIDLNPLFDLLHNPAIVKVFHSGRQDLEIFYNLTGKVVAPLFDSQIAAMVCGYGDSIGYENLVRTITGGQIDKSSQYTDWSVRPLSEKQITYALGDVTHLCDIYLHLKADLEKRGRVDWVMQEEKILGNPDTYANDPYKAWERIKIRSPKSRNLAILRELAAWRELTAQKKDIPKTWVIRDDALAEMAGQAPQTKQQLTKIRNVSKDMAEGRVGAELLKSIEVALASPQNNWPKVTKKKQLSQSTMAVVDILKMLLKIISAEHEVAPKIIANTTDLEEIALNDDADVPALNGWRREIFGTEAIAVKHGRLAIGMKDGKITKFQIDD